MRNKILIYRDYGCADVTNLEQELKHYFTPRGIEIGFTDAAGIINRNELNDMVLGFVMPGGAGTPYRRKLETLGNDKIREFVRNGGIYYGICAGAYYACRQTIFEKDIPELKIISECGLNLIEGKAVGTLHKELGINPYAKNAASAAAVELIWQDNEKHLAYYHGGPYFDIDNAETEILAVYNLPQKYPAVIARNFGQGRVVVSGVHFEDSGKILKKALYNQRIDLPAAQNTASKLEHAETSRQKLFDKIMAAGGR